MIKAILTAVLVGSCMFPMCTYAAASSAHGFKDSSQDFEGYDTSSGATLKNVHLNSDPNTNLYYWTSPDDTSLVSTSIKLEGTPADQYLEISTSEHPYEGLVRNFIPRDSLGAQASNAWTKVAGSNGYDGFYCRFRTKFALYDAELSPELDAEDRLVIWSSKYPDDPNSTTGRLFITAGQYVGSIRNVKPYNYLVATTNVDPDAWHEVALRVIPDLQVGTRALGFEVWIDGNIALPGDDYPVMDASCDRTLLTPEARLLISQRRLFPSLTAPGLTTSVSLGGVAFTGGGVVDDFNFSTNAPFADARPNRICMIKWDAGVKGLKYTVGSESEVIVSDSDIVNRCVEFVVPEDTVTKVSVDVTYDTTGGYSQGFWGAEGAVSLVTNVVSSATNYWFVCDASADTGTGYVRSFRDEIGLGGGGVGAFASFADAKEQAIAQGKVLVLNGDFAASRDTRDEGKIEIAKGETLTIDLNGHTISNVVDEYATIVNYGTLTIIDSQGGGKVLPYLEYTGLRPQDDPHEASVWNYASSRCIPTLTIKGGTYDGVINNSGMVTNTTTQAAMEGNLTIVRSGYDASCPRFISNGGDEFEFNDKLEDKSLYYAYEDPYWTPSTNAFVWCGKGADDKWSTPENWRCGSVPGASDLAIFPAAGTNVWALDIEIGGKIQVGEVMFSGDVNLSGSNEFDNVKWTVPASGRVGGDATLVWKGAIPPDLSTLLGESWSGSVVVAEVGATSPKLLNNLATWGTASSTVRFIGVRGYYQSSVNITVPYTLELVNGANGYGWKNDAGFTGSVIEFPVLTGSGDFISPENIVENQQAIVFRDISGYTGKLDVLGKRVVLGPGDAATTSAGSITWSDGLRIKSGVIHNCRVAAFGGLMYVTGNYDDVLATYTESTVDDSAEIVKLLPGEFDAELCVTNPVGQVKVANWSENAVIINGRRVLTSEPLAVNSQSKLSAPLSQLTALRTMSVASYYTPTYIANGQTVTVKYRLNELAVPVIGDGDESAAITFKDGLASIVVSGVIEGFYYGLEYKRTLDEEWPSKPSYWQQAGQTGAVLELFAPAEGTSGFYRVVVTDVDPDGEAAE